MLLFAAVWLLSHGYYHGFQHGCTQVFSGCTRVVHGLYAGCTRAVRGVFGCLYGVFGCLYGARSSQRRGCCCLIRSFSGIRSTCWQLCRQKCKASRCVRAVARSRMPLLHLPSLCARHAWPCAVVWVCNGWSASRIIVRAFVARRRRRDRARGYGFSWPWMRVRSRADRCMRGGVRWLRARGQWQRGWARRRAWVTGSCFHTFFYRLRNKQKSPMTQCVLI